MGLGTNSVFPFLSLQDSRLFTCWPATASDANIKRHTHARVPVAGVQTSPHRVSTAS